MIFSQSLLFTRTVTQQKKQKRREEINRLILCSIYGGLAGRPTDGDCPSVRPSVYPPAVCLPVRLPTCRLPTKGQCHTPRPRPCAYLLKTVHHICVCPPAACVWPPVYLSDRPKPQLKTDFPLRHSQNILLANPLKFIFEINSLK